MSEENNLDVEDFFKYRSVGSCLSEGISFLTDYFFRFIRMTLPVAIPLSLTMAAMMYWLCDVRLMSASYAIPVVSGLSLLVILLEALHTGQIYMLIRSRASGEDPKLLKTRDLLRRPLLSLSARSLLCDVVEGFVTGCFIFAAFYVATLSIDKEIMVSTATKVIVIAVIGVMYLLVAIPLLLCLPSMALQGGNWLKSMWTGYCYGWKKWTRVFSLGLLAGLIVYVVNILVTSPASIVFLMQRHATQSMLEGDQVIMPSSFPYWAAVIFLLTSFLYVIMRWLMFTPFAYLYASVRTDVEEEEKSKLPII